jgi:hypothetical protein
VLGGGTAPRLAGFDRAWMVVVITAAITAVAGLATGRPLTGVPGVAADAGTAGDAGRVGGNGTGSPPPLPAGRRYAELAHRRHGGDRFGC